MGEDSLVGFVAIPGSGFIEYPISEDFEGQALSYTIDDGNGVTSMTSIVFG